MSASMVCISVDSVPSCYLVCGPVQCNPVRAASSFTSIRTRRRHRRRHYSPILRTTFIPVPTAAPKYVDADCTWWVPGALTARPTRALGLSCLCSQTRATSTAYYPCSCASRSHSQSNLSCIVLVVAVEGILRRHRCLQQPIIRRRTPSHSLTPSQMVCTPTPLFPPPGCGPI